jgi:hypothetical protein
MTTWLVPDSVAVDSRDAGANHHANCDSEFLF